MDWEAPSKSSRVVYWLVGLLIVIGIGGVSTWLYLAGLQNTATPIQTVKPAATTQTATSTDSVLVAPTTINTNLTDLDNELATIDADLSSTNDNAPSL